MRSELSIGEDCGGRRLTVQRVQKCERAANRISASKLYDIAAVLEAPVESFYAGLAPTGAPGCGALSAVALTLACLPEAVDLAEPMSRLSRPQRKLVVALAVALAAAQPATD